MVTATLTPLADFLQQVLAAIRPLPPLDLELTQAYGNVFAEDVVAPGPLPAFDHAAIDGYAVRLDDVVGAREDRPVRLNVVGDVGAASWRPVRVSSGSCLSVAAGAPMPAAADAVVPTSWTDEGMASVEIYATPKRGHGVRRAGEELAVGAVVAQAGTQVTAPMVALLAAAGVAHVVVRPCPRVVVVSTGDELVETGRMSAPGQVVDVNSHALTAAAVEAGALAYRIGICDDDPEGLRAVLEDQTLRSDLIVMTGGTGHGPGDMVRRIFGRDGTVGFTDLSVYPCSSLGFGTVGVEEVPIVCLPGDPGTALIGFEVLVRPVIQRLAGAEPVFRPSIKAHLLETLSSPAGLREFRPALVSERRGGGYTVQPLAGGPYTLSGLADANGLLVLGERVSTAAAGSTVDVLLIDRRR
ncbi:molybdopterin molybdenumtransferase MoeA [Actinocatenispora thailandica]|uniref:Molybdopterin molybdenumtransferase n=1 Tax=Actinocatenispora thailandica TaxID=227318 RepID=A0A7R7DJL7_9ACTN|nr:gephyrin-like molybdotransferase Glp [Actinocatenispora thailandica]BCJ32924.1 molybdopterin molybdenumtransferase MoeA [Actinocatenispora thailandica]